jgi:hypothetical protein
MRQLLLAGVLTAGATVPAFAGPMTIGERQRLVAHFEMTEAWLERLASGRRAIAPRGAGWLGVRTPSPVKSHLPH